MYKVRLSDGRTVTVTARDEDDVEAVVAEKFPADAGCPRAQVEKIEEIEERL